MQIHITGRNLEITPALKQFAEEKLQKLENHDQHITQIDLTLLVEKVLHIAEGTAHLGGIEFHATAESEDMYTAIDQTIAKLLVQITKHKEKTTDHHR